MTQNKLRPHGARVLNRLTLLFILVVLLVVPESRAQQGNVTASQQSSGAGEERRDEFGIWGGISFRSPRGSAKRPTRDSVTLDYAMVGSWQQMIVLPFHGPLTLFRWPSSRSTASQSYQQAHARSRFNARESIHTALVCHR